MGTEIFPLRGTDEREIDNDGMPLTGVEVQQAVCADLDELVGRVRAILREKADLGKQYAYPRVRWSISLTITPYYSDEAPVVVEESGGVEITEGKGDEPIVANVVQPPVNDADRLRPDKKLEPKRHEESSKTPLTLNPMVRMEEKS